MGGKRLRGDFARHLTSPNILSHIAIPAAFIVMFVWPSVVLLIPIHFSSQNLVIPYSRIEKDLTYLILQSIVTESKRVP